MELYQSQDIVHHLAVMAGGSFGLFVARDDVNTLALAVVTIIGVAVFAGLWLGWTELKKWILMLENTKDPLLDEIIKALGLPQGKDLPMLPSLILPVNKDLD